MSWRRLGRIYAPDAHERPPELATHGANPLAAPRPDGSLAVLFNGRDADNRSSVGEIAVDPASWRPLGGPRLRHSPDPADRFSRDGISIGDWLPGDAPRLLVMGWRREGAGAWRGTIGIVGESFVPLLAPDDAIDGTSLSYPGCYRDADGRLTLLYETTQRGAVLRHPLHRATSADGTTWQRHGAALAPVAGLTTGYSRPSILAADGKWELWASRLGPAGERYHIGHASSRDGVRWQPSAEPALRPSGQGWDGAMVCYPCVFAHGGRRFLLYSGNDYGRTGFGVAVWEGA